MDTEETCLRALCDDSRFVGPLGDQYLEWLNAQRRFDLETCDHTVLRRASSPARPYLSVVVRTQGRRPLLLRQALACLGRQTDDDFEVVVVVHRADETGWAVVDEVLADVDASDAAVALSDRLTVARVDEGTVAHPLNVGFALARGMRIAILDDDDLVLDHWIASFRRVAHDHPGTIVYCGVQTQGWKVEPDGTAVALEQPQPTYCQPFDMVELIDTNRCPTMGLAFPRAIFHDVGITFDESLNTMEDWDFLLRAMLVCGLSMDLEPTGIYRLFESSDSSHVLNDDRVWGTARLAIHQKLEQMPLLFPAGSAHALVVEKPNELRAVAAGEVELYLDAGEGFNLTTMRHATQVTVEGAVNRVTFDDLAMLGPVKAIRFDPLEHGFITMEHPFVTIVTSGGEERRYGVLDMQYSDARIRDEKLVFFKDDPRIVLAFNEPIVIARVIAEFGLFAGVKDTDVDDAVAYYIERATAEKQQRAMSERAARDSGRKGSNASGDQAGDGQSAARKRTSLFRR